MPDKQTEKSSSETLWPKPAFIHPTEKIEVPSAFRCWCISIRVRLAKLILGMSNSQIR